VHCTPEQLALAALSEPLPADDAAHLAGCARCRAEVDSLRQPVDVLAVPPLAGAVTEVPPPPRVWAAIAAATGVTAEPRPAPELPAAAPDAPVVDLPSRRTSARPARPVRRWLAVAAAVLVGAGIGGSAVALTRAPDATPDPGGSVVAQTALDPYLGADASGLATVRQTDGTWVLQVDLQAPPLDDAYYEVWLMETGAQLMVPVGVLHSGDTELPLPDGLDLSAYPLVDVSVEPLDGRPAHSGLSVARGELDI
jgi:hypothetical protein